MARVVRRAVFATRTAATAWWSPGEALFLPVTRGGRLLVRRLTEQARQLAGRTSVQIAAR